ncbi:MAG TPA: glycosyltransferase family 4 protein [Solirubrobacteraceae bacterium]|nr:glycosyltransferase family 4 protein [Solirubrobacteraceae bacterium]
MTRVALVRGTLLRAVDLPTYEFGAGEGVEVELFLSRGLAERLGPVPFRVHGLRSPADLHARLPLPVRMAVNAAVWNTDHLIGLEERVRGFDLIHTVELHAPIVEQSLRLRDAGHVRAVVSTVMENIPFFPATSPLVRRRVARIAPRVDLYVAVTERAKLHVLSHGVPEERVEVLPVGVDTERFAPSPERRASGGPLRVVTVSRLETGKGVEDLAIAAGLLARRGVAIEVTYVGEGPSRPRIEEVARHFGIGDRVRFAGIVPWERLHEVHHEQDVFVLASAPTSNWREQFGYAVVEAMACGLPVLVGNSGSLMEVAGREDALVTPHDPLSLAAALERLARDEALRAELGVWNRRRALERFDARVVRARLRELYERALYTRAP